MKYLSIHGLVGIQVSSNYQWLNTLIPNIPMFVTDKKSFEQTKSKITIKYQKTVSLPGAYEVVPELFINRHTDQVYDKKYGAVITKTADGYSIICSQECNEWVMMLLEYLLLKNHATFIHSAGVEKDGAAYIFPSWGGVGKTASVAKLIREKGYKLLGDDLNILAEDGTVYAFPKKFVLYAYHRNLFSDTMKGTALVGGGLSKFASKMIPSVKSTLRHFPGLLAWARRHNPQSKRISPYEIFGEEQIAISGKLKAATWLERIDIPKTTKVNTNYYDLAAKSLSITIHELFEGRLEEFIIALCAGDFDYKVLFDDSIDFIAKTIKPATLAQLFIPQDYPIENVASDVVDYTEKTAKLTPPPKDN